MKLCPKCKAELEDSARFCLRCMTSFEDKEQIEPPKRSKRRWPLVLLICLIICGAVIALIIAGGSDEPQGDETTTTAPTTTTTTTTSTTTTTISTTTTTVPDNSGETREYTVNGVTYTLRPATRDDHPSAISLDNYYTLISVEGVPDDGVYRVPSFADEDMSLNVVAVADGAFDGADATVIDLGYNVRYVWGDAFGGCALEELYLHGDTFIDRAAFSGCTSELTIHCPSYIENTQGDLWSELAVTYGYGWQDEII